MAEKENDDEHLRDGQERQHQEQVVVVALQQPPDAEQSGRERQN